MVLRNRSIPWQLVFAWIVGIIALINVFIINTFPLEQIRYSYWSLTFIIVRVLEFSVLLNTAIRESIARRKAAWIYLSFISFLGFFLFFASRFGFNTDYISAGIFLFMIFGLAVYFPTNVWSTGSTWRVITNSLAITFSTIACLQSLIYYIFGVSETTRIAAGYAIWSGIEFAVFIGSFALYYRYKSKTLILVCIASLCLVLADTIGILRTFLPGVYRVSGLPEMSLYFIQAMSVMIFAYYSVENLKENIFDGGIPNLIEWFYWNGIPRFIFTASIAFLVLLHPPEVWVILCAIITIFIREIFSMYEEHYLLKRLYQMNSASQEQVEQATANLTIKNTLLEQALEEVTRLTIEKERNRLAREIHDGIGQYLQSSIMLAGGLLEREPEPARERTLSHLLNTLTTLKRELRRAIHALSENEPIHLEESLAGLVDYYRIGGPTTRLDILGQPWPVAPLARHTLYRIAQEALTNTTKHAQAQEVVLTLDYRDQQAVTLTIEDDGLGFPADDIRAGRTTGLGLRSMRERATLAGGQLLIESATEGVRIWVSIPNRSQS